MAVHYAAVSIAFPPTASLNVFRVRESNSEFSRLRPSAAPWPLVGCVGEQSGEKKIAAALINNWRELPFLPSRGDYLLPRTDVIHRDTAEAGDCTWSTIWRGGGKQPCKPPIDLCLAALRGPMPSIIDLGAIIKHPVWNKENICPRWNAPPHQLDGRELLL